MVLAPFRYRAHLPVPEADAGLDHPAPARPGRGRHLDLADPRRLRPAMAGPPPQHRPPPPLGETRPARPADPGPGPPRVPAPPPDDRPSGQGTQTLPARSRP